jgi:hypothetical protein
LRLPERDALLAEARTLTEVYKSGGQGAARAFRELTALLFRLTILAPEGGVRLFSGPRGHMDFVLGGWRGPDDPLPLTDGRFLRLTARLYVTPPAEGSRLKVEASSYQYQMDQEGNRWIFRYDYLRNPPDPHPSAHLQIRGNLVEYCLPQDTSLQRVHFPTTWVSVEAVIRLLADQFGTPCHREPDLWRPLLAETERAFLEIAHRPIGGPER